MTVPSDHRSRRSPVVATNGAVATSQPLAAQAGLRMLQDGGNAADAAVAASAVLAVVEPMSTGLGGDLFALIWSAGERTAHAFNGSGRSPAAADLGDLARRGLPAIPESGPGVALAVSVPGAVDGWQRVLERHGTMDLDRVLAPAIRYATEGFGVSPVVARLWQRSAAKLVPSEAAAEYLPGGRAPVAGQRVSLPALAETLGRVAAEGPDVLYRGEIGARIAALVQQFEGWLTVDDLAAHTGEWVEPMSTGYRGTTLVECPPNGQGVAALVAAAVAAGLDAPDRSFGGAAWTHLLIEAVKVGLDDAFSIVADDAEGRRRAEACLDPNRIARVRSAISTERAGLPVPLSPFGPPRDTAFVCAIDGEGNGVSMISSLFRAFGSGLVVPGTGIILQNRAALFSTDPGHPNALAGGRRPFHTIIPALLLRDGALTGTLGVVGGYQQAQAHLQLLSRLVDGEMDPQRALDQPRFSVDVEQSGRVRVEEGTSSEVVEALEALGHRPLVVTGDDRLLFGTGQILTIDPDTKVVTGGTDPRHDGIVAGW